MVPGAVRLSIAPKLLERAWKRSASGALGKPDGVSLCFVQGVRDQYRAQGESIDVRCHCCEYLWWHQPTTSSYLRFARLKSADGLLLSIPKSLDASIDNTSLFNPRPG